MGSSIKRRIAIEAGATGGWHQYVGEAGHVIGIDRFGVSAPEKAAFQDCGMTIERVLAAVAELS